MRLRLLLLLQNDKVVIEGLTLLSSLLLCDRVREAEKRKRMEEDQEEEANAANQDDNASPTAMSISASSASATTPRQDDNQPRQADHQLDSCFNMVLVEVLKDSLPALVQRLTPEGVLELSKPDWQRESDAKQAESDAMLRQQMLERDQGSLVNGKGTNDHGQRGTQRKRPFGLLRLKIAESMRALVLHFTVPSTDDTLAGEFFTLLMSLNFPALLMVSPPPLRT
jgi:hypothetical protein